MFILTYRDNMGDEAPISPHRTLTGAKVKAQTCEGQAAQMNERKPARLKWKHHPERPAQHSSTDPDGGHYYIYKQELEP